MSRKLKMESSSHVWGMPEYHVQGCVALLRTVSLSQDCVWLPAVRGATRSPSASTRTLLPKEVRTSPTLKLNQRLQTTLCKWLVLVPNYCTDIPKGCILQRLHLLSSKPVNFFLLQDHRHSTPSLQSNREHAYVTHPESTQQIKVTLEQCNRYFSFPHFYSYEKILQVYLKEKSFPQ